MERLKIVQRFQCPILQRPSRDVVDKRCYTCIRRLSTRHVPKTDNRSAKERMACYHADSGADRAARPFKTAVPRIPSPDKNSEINMIKNKDTHPPSPKESQATFDKSRIVSDSKPRPPCGKMNCDEIRFLADVACRPLLSNNSSFRPKSVDRFLSGGPDGWVETEKYTDCY
jgi:hypothetical protein